MKPLLIIVGAAALSGIATVLFLASRTSTQLQARGGELNAQLTSSAGRTQEQLRTLADQGAASIQAHIESEVRSHVVQAVPGVLAERGLNAKTLNSFITLARRAGAI